MGHGRFRFAECGLLSTLLVFFVAESANANFIDLLKRVPDSTNMLVMIDVDRLLASPIAVKEKWRDRGNTAEGHAIHIPVNAERYMLASKLNFVSNFENIWDIALIETKGGISLPYLSKMEGGYLDTVEGQQVAYSPRNAFFVALTPSILGVSFPANRQDLARWLRSIKNPKEPQVSDYLRNAFSQAHGKDHLVIGIDLADLFTAPMIKQRLQAQESLAGKNLDFDMIAGIMSSVKGVTLSMTATDQLNGKIRVDLGVSPEPLREVAKAIFFQVLENQGMMLDEMKNWRLLFDDKGLVLEGRLTAKGLKTLTDLIPFPVEAQAANPNGNGPENAGNAATVSPAAAAKKYFQSILTVLGNLRAQLKEPNVSSLLAERYVTKAAMEIDRLPVLNVDEELMEFGTAVSTTLRNMRNLSKNASLDAAFRQAGIASAGTASYSGPGGFYYNGNIRLNTSTMRKQETALLKSNELAVFTMLEEKTAEMRKKMTVKFGVEF